MNRIISGIVIAFILCGFLNCELFAKDSFIISSITPQIVRVGISDNYFSNYLFNKTSITSVSDYVLSDNYSGEVELKGNEVININFYNGEFTVYKDSELIFKTQKDIHLISTNGSAFQIIGLKRKGKTALYSGSIELIKGKTKTDKFAIVNVLPLQTYLKGVVPNEMPTSFGIEALKAQAVLARNYVLKPRENYYKEFDICDSTACQVYFGANTQEPLSDKAVDETQNIVVMYDSDLILAVYSSTAGGYTESYKNVFMQNMQGRIMSPNVPYLIGKPDKDSININLDTEEKAREFYSSSPDTFDNSSPYFRWKREWDIKDFENTVSKNIKSLKNTGFIRTKYNVDYNDKNYFGKLKSVFINKRGVSGKVVALTLITDKNEFTIYKELIIRKVLQNQGKLLPSANVFFDVVNDDGKMKVVATGGGFGHGVGMSQWGAGSMAKQGYKFDDIIHHYYTDVNLSVKPVYVAANQPQTIEFYVDNKASVKKAVLRFEKDFNFSLSDIIINDKPLEDSLASFWSKEEKIKISDYLKKGKNIITYNIKSNNTTKKIKFWVELE